MSTEEEPQEPSAEEAAAATQAGKTVRPARLIVLFSIVLLLSLFALGGIFAALTGKHEAPDSVNLPTHTLQELEDIQAAAPKAKPQPSQSIIPEQSHEPEEEQTETPLKLNSLTPMPHGESDFLKKKDSAPQSIIVWDRPSFPAPKPVINFQGKQPQIVIVIDDMGLNIRNSNQMVQMPAPVTLAYLPYASNLPRQAKAAYERGHELIVHMPMEPDDIAHNNPGPNALLSTLPADENLKRLTKNLSGFDEYIGLNNHMGSKITANATAMRPIMQAVKERGLWFLDSRTIGNSVAGKLAAELNIPYVERDVFLDNVENVSTILGQLRQVQQIAQKRGYAVAIGHPHNATIAALKQWLPDAQKRGFKMVPLSAIIAVRYPAAKVPHYAQLKKTIMLSQHTQNKT